MYLHELTTSLRGCGVTFAPGLTSREVASIEAYYAFRFPPDLRVFLQHALPVSDGFVNWREYQSDAIAYRVEEPFLGLLHAVEHGFWLHSWGEWPYSPVRALAIAQRHLHSAPRLIPIHKHRYLPAAPCLPGNPVLSVWGSDIIYYGSNLADYLATEFPLITGYLLKQEERPYESAPSAAPTAKQFLQHPRPVRFWDNIIAAWD